MTSVEKTEENATVTNKVAQSPQSTVEQMTGARWLLELRDLKIEQLRKELDESEVDTQALKNENTENKKTIEDHNKRLEELNIALETTEHEVRK